MWGVKGVTEDKFEVGDFEKINDWVQSSSPTVKDEEVGVWYDFDNMAGSI